MYHGTAVIYDRVRLRTFFGMLHCVDQTYTRHDCVFQVKTIEADDKAN